MQGLQGASVDPSLQAGTVAVAKVEKCFLSGSVLSAT